jgi:hypothetical protein
MMLTVTELRRRLEASKACREEEVLIPKPK